MNVTVFGTTPLEPAGRVASMASGWCLNHLDAIDAPPNAPLGGKRSKDQKDHTNNTLLRQLLNNPIRDKLIILGKHPLHLLPEPNQSRS